MRHLLAASVVLLLLAACAMAESPADKQLAADNLISPGAMTPTPEMWFYQQYQRQYQDPQAMVHQKADQRATERQRRLGAMKWYGMSNQRPRATPDPINGDYSASWASGDNYYPTRWQFSPPLMVLPKASDR